MAPLVSPESSEVLAELVQLGIALSREGELQSLLERIVTQARRFTGAEAATLFLREGSHLRFTVAQNEAIARRLGDEEMRRHLETDRLPLDVPSFAGYVALTGNVLNVADAYDLPPGQPYAFNWRVDVVTGYRTRSVLSVPLRDTSRRVLGVLQLINAVDAAGEVTTFHPTLEDVARAFASYATVAVRGARLEELSFRDPLTESYNRRYLMLRLDEEAKRSERSKEPLSLILLDLDQFKTVNDRWGHAAGDEVLKEVVQVLASQSRRYTVVARYGGDEFIALLPNAAKEAAVVYAERLRAIVERYPFKYGPVTASFGVACFPDDTESAGELIRRADHALYEAKRQGRNVVALPSGGSALHPAT